MKKFLGVDTGASSEVSKGTNFEKIIMLAFIHFQINIYYFSN